MISYERLFIIQAAHFNDVAYQVRERALRAWEIADWLSVRELWKEVCLETHGHNFEIKVSITGQPRSLRESWIVDDAELAKIVMAWDNKNLSMLPEFAERDLRATTENMAVLLQSRIERLLVEDKLFLGQEPPVVLVQVRETRDIAAMAGFDR